jgi:hypothetical protein
MLCGGASGPGPPETGQLPIALTYLFALERVFVHLEREAIPQALHDVAAFRRFGSCWRVGQMHA